MMIEDASLSRLLQTPLMFLFQKFEPLIFSVGYPSFYTVLKPAQSHLLVVVISVDVDSGVAHMEGYVTGCQLRVHGHVRTEISYYGTVVDV